ncbi:hypothetical protein PRZ48_005525 [Zasmidium cellare]|uniref:D-aminoacid aminotransferase-like PLP-dependent enzyme n=1 Tax=Zasmidium cellare TaxID=395010 RepID=A0ABR0EKR9_ZASCE|nr:hypothetical protein PRZ48_005525 [Zasmidium cellare]
MQRIFSAYQQRTSQLSKSTHPFAKGVAWIAGDLVPLQEAKIPLMDQGFLHSDLTYDVPAVWDGRFFRLHDHLDRFELSCGKIRLRLPISKAEIKDILVRMVSESGIRDAFVELICTRGMQGVRDQMMSTGPPAPHNLYLFITPYIWVMQPELQLKGTGSAIVARTVRRTPPGAFDPTVKNLQWGDLTRGMFEAADRGAQYPFLTDGDGNLTEGSGFNVVIIKHNVFYTPDRGVLQGVTRKSVMEVARKLGYEVRLEVVPVELCYRADEIFMCTTAGGVMPITSLDGEKVGDGKVGPVTRKVWDGYWEMHYDPKLSFAIEYQTKSKL